MSFGEIFLIMIFILLFFGSESIPNIARTLGRGMRQIRDATNEVKEEIRKSADKVAEESGITKLRDEGVDEIEKEIEKSVRLDQDFEDEKSA